MSEDNKSVLDLIKQRKSKALDIRYFINLIKKLILVSALAFILVSFVFGLKIVENEDMKPKLVPTDLAIYFRLDKNYYQNDLVVAKKDGADYILRVVGQGGDTIDITDQGLVINGASQGESDIYYQTGIYPDGITFPISLKEDEYFLLGDLREGAKDSRYFGPVKKEEIKGKVFALIRRTDF